jgi:conjugal transfer pilus assembly protein TraF
MEMLKQIIASLTLAFAATSSFSAGMEFYDNKERGWFWWEDPPVQEPEQPSPPPAPEAKEDKAEPAKPKAPKPLSSKWLREKLPELLDSAIDNPTPSNVRAYRYAERYAAYKADRYSEESIKATMNDPYLDANSFAPMSASGEDSLSEASKIGTKKAMSIISARAGLWFFFRSDCQFCHQQAGALSLLQAKGMSVMAISTDGKGLNSPFFKDFKVDRGQARMLGVESVPSIFMVDAKTGNATYVAQGIIAADELVERVIAVARTNNIISEKTYQATRFSKTPDSGDNLDLTEEEVKDPEKLAKAVRSALRNQIRYQSPF